MAARAALQELLEGDGPLALEAVYPTNSVDTPEEEWFAVVRWDLTTAAFKTTGTDRASIWLHDKQKDYGRINDGLNRLRELLTEAVHRQGGDGWSLTVAEWNGESPDLFDPGYGTLTRYADFTVVSRYNPS
jgi:hypothetical protein